MSLNFGHSFTPEQETALRNAAYGVAAKLCKPHATTNAVAVVRLSLESDGVVHTSKCKTWGCHNVIKESWETGGEALYTNRQYKPETDSEATKAWADYYTKRSPYAPFLLSTPDEYCSAGLLVSSYVPANVMASICIGSRLIGKKDNTKFADTFYSFVQLGVPEDAATLFSHWLKVDEKSNHLYFQSGGDHGLFYGSSYISPCVIWSWLNRRPFYLTDHKYAESTSDSTYGGVYALWDGVTTSGTENTSLKRKLTREVPFGGLNLWEKLSRYVSARTRTASTDSGLNPFLASTKFIINKEAEKRKGSETLVLTTETRRVLSDFINKVHEVALNSTEEDFVEFWNKL